MNIKELLSAKIWSVAAASFIPAVECESDLSSLEWDDEYIVLRKSEYIDKSKIEVFEGDILSINPDDDDWMDIVVYKTELTDFKVNSINMISYSGQKVNRLELMGFEGYNRVTSVDLASAFSEDNPAVIVGNVLTHPHLAMQILTKR